MTERKFEHGYLWDGDCLEVMDLLLCMNFAESVDLILADLPYGTTQNKWDSIIDLSELWMRYWQLLKPNGAIVLTAQSPFDKILGASMIEYYKYEWIWKKTYHTGHLNSKKMPLKNHENVLVFYKKLPTYNPQMTKGEPYTSKVPEDAKTSSNYGKQSAYEINNTGERYPRSVLTFDKAKGKYHPTQKPVALFEYMIKTYTNPGEWVLDNVMGSGTTAIACENTGRNWLGIEREQKYIDIIIERLQEQGVTHE